MGEEELKLAIKEMESDVHVNANPGSGDPEDLGVETEPLIPDRSSSVSPRPTSIYLRQRRRRIQWLIFTASVLFIFFSIAFLFLYFTLPSVIKKRLGEEKGFKTDSLRLSNVTDKAFDVECGVRAKVNTPLGSKVLLKNGQIVYDGNTVASFDMLNRIYIPRNVDEVRALVNLHVVITDPEHFGLMINAILLKERVNVTINSNLLLKPDYLPPLPATRVTLNVPIEGIPTLQSTKNTPFVDIIKGTLHKLLIKGSRDLPDQYQIPYIPLSFFIQSTQGHPLAKVYSIDSYTEGQISGIVEMPPLNDAIRSMVKGELGAVHITGNVQETHPLLRRIVSKVDASIKIERDVPNLAIMKEIIILDVWGKTASIASNPFSTPLHVHQLDKIDIFHDGKFIGTINNLSVNQTIPPHTDAFPIRNDYLSAGIIKFNGGVRGAFKLLKEITYNGFITVDIAGTMSVSIDEWQAQRLPMSQKGLRVTTRRSTTQPLE